MAHCLGSHGTWMEPEETDVGPAGISSQPDEGRRIYYGPVRRPRAGKAAEGSGREQKLCAARRLVQEQSRATLAADRTDRRAWVASRSPSSSRPALLGPGARAWAHLGRRASAGPDGLAVHTTGHGLRGSRQQPSPSLGFQPEHIFEGGGEFLAQIFYRVPDWEPQTVLFKLLFCLKFFPQTWLSAVQ